jgi:pSer/pThr/pTyr-binding forkhead associated (FHA) protein
VHADFDDTVIAPQRPAAAPGETDFDDTVIRPSAALASPQPFDLVSPPESADETKVTALRYAFRIGGSRVIPLDSITYLGRRPSAPRIMTAGVPRLVRVPSPQGEVSATHIELRQLGATVVVTDMRSTNGTVISVPGQAARSLRQGESIVVTPGTLVDVGDDNVIEILPLQDLS